MRIDKSKIQEALLQQSSEALIAVSLEGTILSWNVGASSLFGFTQEEAVGHTLEELVAPSERREEARRMLAETLERGTRHFETVRRKRDGQSIAVDVTMRCVVDDAGAPWFVAVSEKDVTLLKGLRESQSSEEKFRGLLEAAPDAIVIAGSDGRIVVVNRQTERLFGYDRSELLGQSIEILVPERYRSAHMGHRVGYFRDPRLRALCAGLELYGQRKDGTEFPAEISLAPMPTTEGVLVTAAIRDSSARKREQEKFRRLLEAAPDAMVIANAEGTIAIVNAQAESLFGYSREELLGQKIELLIPERYRAAHSAHRGNYFFRPRVRPMGAGGFALFGLRKDGTEFPAEISLSPLETDEGIVVITTIRDISERRRIEEAKGKLIQAQEAVRMRDEFLAVASHELKTPLTAVLMQTDAILRLARKDEGVTLSERLVGRLQSIHGGALRLNALITQLLDLSQITAGHLTIQREEVDLAAIVRETCRISADEIHRSGGELVVHADAKVVGHWDAMRLEQIITNLLSNASKYGRGKPIEVTVGESSVGIARLTVRDHGIGIAPEHQARIFERFERVLSERHYGGVGLGLWIVRQLVEAHRGTIGIESQPGAGTTFTVDLPRYDDEGAHAEDAALRTANTEAKCVMIVDDDAMIRESIIESLKDKGIDVVGAENGLAALELLRTGLRPRLIFLDLMMPVMDAWGFRAEQQKSSDFAAIPVAILSAADHLEKRAGGLGAAAYLSKPVNVTSLLRVVEPYYA